MINLHAQQLMSLVDGARSRDLNKALTMDFTTGEYAIDRNTEPGSRRLSERTFISSDQVLTKAGQTNAGVRMMIANALNSFNDEVETASAAQRQFLQSAFRELLGTDSVNGEMSKSVACRPIEVRRVKQLLEKAASLFAVAQTRGDVAKAARNANLYTILLRETAALNGKSKAAEKLIARFEADTSAIGAQIVRTDDPQQLATLQNRLRQVLTNFNRRASESISRMTTVAQVARGVLQRYMAKKHVELSDITCTRFAIYYSRTQLEPGMNVKRFKAQLEGKVEEFLRSVTTPEQVDATTPLKTVTTNLAGLREADHAAWEQGQRDVARQQQGQVLTTTKRITLAPELFDTSVFLRGQFQPTERLGDVACALKYDLAQVDRVDSVTVKIDRNSYVNHFDNNETGLNGQRVDKNLVRFGTAGTVAGLVRQLCGAYTGNMNVAKANLQAAGVLSALMLRVDMFTKVVARETGMGGEWKGGNVYHVSRADDGSVLVKISTSPKSALSSSVTLRIARDGTRSVVAFSGVKTNEAYAEVKELAERRTQLGQQIPGLEQEIQTAIGGIRQQLEQEAARQAVSAERATALVQSAEVFLNGQLDALRALARADGMPNREDFSQYQAEFRRSLAEVVERCTSRIAVNVGLTGRFAQIGGNVDIVCDGALQRFGTLKNEAVVAQVKSLKERFGAYLERLRSDFYLSGEISGACAAEVEEALERFADRLGKLLADLPDRFESKQDFEALAELQGMQFPRLAFVTFSEDARTRMLEGDELVSCAEVSKLAAGNDSFASIAEAVNTFTASVNELLTQAKSWPGAEARREFAEMAKAKTAEIIDAVKTAQTAGVDFSRGATKLLHDAFDAVATRFREVERQNRVAEFDQAVAAARTRLEAVLAEKRQNSMTKFQCSAIEGVLKQIAAYPGLVKADTIPSHAAVRIFALELAHAVDAFVGHLNNDSAGAVAKRFFAGFSFFGEKKVPEMSDLYPFHGPEGELATDDECGRNPFGEVGIGSLAELNRVTRATTAVKQALAANPDLMERATAIFENMEGVEALMEVDELGNVLGFREIDGVVEGRRMLAVAFHEVEQVHVAELVRQMGEQDMLVDVDLAVTEEWKLGVLAEVHDKLALALQQRQEDAQVNAQAMRAEHPDEIFPRGETFLGIDIHALTPDQHAALKSIVLGSLLDSQRQAYHDMEQDYAAMPETNQDEIEAKQAMRDRIDARINTWMSSAMPGAIYGRGDQRPYAEKGDTAVHIYPAVVEAFRQAVRTGALPLNGRLDEHSVSVLAMLCNRAALGIMDPSSRGTNNSTGFGTLNPGAVLSALHANGIPPQQLSQRIEAGHLTEREMADLLEFLFMINQFSANGLDSLCLRIFGKGILEIERADLNILRGKYIGDMRDLYAAHPEMMDPLRLMDDANRKVADFFLRTGVPTTEHVRETLALYHALGGELARADHTVALTYAGRRVRLNSLANSRLMLTFEGIRLEGEAATRNVKILCPLDVPAFRAQLADEISLKAEAYGLDVALQLVEGLRDTSSHARQVALNVISGLSGVLATELCHLQTWKVIDIARRLLQRKIGGAGDSTQFVKAELAQQADGQEQVLFNGEATLDVYGAMVREITEHGRNQVDRKVTIPDERRRREGETIAQARLRQVHEFVSELVMPNDTTKFDLDRRDGKSANEILRATMLAHRYELNAIMRSLGTADDVLDSFSMVGGDVPEGGREPPRMTEMTNVLKARMLQLKDMIARAGGMDAFFVRLSASADVRDEAIETFLTGFSADVESASYSMLGKMQQMLTAKLKAAFQHSMIAKQKPLWQQTLDEIAGSGTLDVESGYGEFLMESLATYFTSMEPIDRRRMSSALFRYAGATSTAGELLGALIKGAGPVLQKLMQGLPQTALPDDLRSAITDLKSELPPIAPEMVRAMLLDMVNLSNGRISSIELTKSLGAATVGQAFLCRVYTTDNPAGEECVIKLLRPDVQNRARRERARFLQLAAKNETMRRALEARLESIFEELDFTIEANNVKEGVVYNSGVVNDGIKGVKSMELYPYIAASANAMVLRKAPGTTYDRFIRSTDAQIRAKEAAMNVVRNPDGTTTYSTRNAMDFVNTRTWFRHVYSDLLMQQKRLAGFIEKWTYEVFFGDGFFHGDLHAGNIMCGESALTVIDYGNAQRLSKAEMKNLKWALAWIPARDVSHFLSYYRNVLSDDGKKQLDAKRDVISRELGNVFERGNVDDIGKILSAVFEVIQSNGVELPGSIFCIMQSMQRLDESMRLLNEQMAKIKEVYSNYSLTMDDQADDRVRGFAAIVLDGLKNRKLDIRVNAHGEQQARTLQVTYKEVFEMAPTMSGDERQDVFNRLLTELQDMVRESFIEEGPASELSKAKQTAEGLYRPETKAAALEEFRTLVANVQAAAAPFVGSSDIVVSMPASEMVQVAKRMQAMLDRFDAEPVPTLDEVKAELTVLYDKASIGVATFVSQELKEYYGSRTVPVGMANYDDPSVPFGKALSRGSRAFIRELVPPEQNAVVNFINSASLAMSGGLTLRDKLEERAKSERRREKRVDFFRTDDQWRRFAAQNGLYPLEVEALRGEMGKFRFGSDVSAFLRGGDAWLRDAGKRDLVRQTLQYNLDCMFATLAAKGFNAHAQNPQNRAALIKYAMTFLCTERPEWFRAFRNVTAEQLQPLVGNSADLSAAFGTLREIAHGELPNRETLSPEEDQEIHNDFRQG